MQLLYDDRDDVGHPRSGDRRLEWLDDRGALPLSEAAPGEDAFLFAGARPIDDYRQLVADLPLVRDRPADRAPLLRLDDVLDALSAAAVAVPTPRTWRLPLDAALPSDLTFPLFVRTAYTSWKLGGRVSKVHSVEELESEAAALRRALGWDALILARAWCELVPTGRTVYGPVPVEVRAWIVDGVPHAWSFHYQQVVPDPAGFPLPMSDVATLRALAAEVGRAFTSRLVVADFAKATDGRWMFIEAGPGSCAGTAHEAVFKSVAARLSGQPTAAVSTDLGGTFHGSPLQMR